MSKIDMLKFVALTAVSRFANRKVPDNILDEGKTHDVQLKVVGRINGKQVEIPINGNLEIGITDPTGYTKQPCKTTLLARAIELLPVDIRNRFLRIRTLPKTTKDSISLAKALTAKLVTYSPRRGSTVFKESGDSGKT